VIVSASGARRARLTSRGELRALHAVHWQLNPWAPPALVPVLAWTATAAELVCGVALIAGFLYREVAVASGVLLCLFAFGMTIGTGVKTALDASAFSAAAAASPSRCLGPGSWSLDGLRR